MSDVLEKATDWLVPQFRPDLRLIAFGVIDLFGTTGWIAAEGVIALVASEAHSGVPAGEPLGVTDPMTGTITPFSWIPQESSATYNYSCVAYGGGGVASVDNPTRTQTAVVTTDGDGDAVARTPAAPSEFAAQPTAGGKFLLTWRYSGSPKFARPVQFNIYNDAGTGAVNYAVVVGTVPAKGFRNGAGEYSWRSAAFADSTAIKWAIRAEAAGDLEEANMTTVTATADATGPAAIAISTVTYGADA